MVLISNLHQLIVSGAETELRADNQTRKYRHKINNNVSLGFMKDAVIDLLKGGKPERVLGSLVEKFLKHTIPVKPGRSNPRNKEPRRIRGKYRTLTNYRRAA